MSSTTQGPKFKGWSVRGGWQVYVTAPRDWLDSALPVRDWLMGLFPSKGDMLLDEAFFLFSMRFREYEAALDAVREHPFWEVDGLRHEPRVLYNPVTDEPYFLFKLNNNGTSFIVSRDPIEGLEILFE